MDLATFEQLSGDEGRELMEAASMAYADHAGDPVAAASSLARTSTATPALRSAALTQVGLRVRAVAKFGDEALRLWFTSDALEQATRSRVAAHRAARIALSEPRSVIDLGCGIGGDLMALARAGVVAAGVDSDPLRVAIARANLAALGLDGAVAVADAVTVDRAPFDLAFADPARRSGAGRRFRPDDWTPSWSFVEELLAARAVVKVAPGIPHDLVPEGGEAEWVSDDGGLKEASLWSPGLASCRRRATVIGGGGLATLTDEDDPWQDRERPVRGLGQFLYEPDDAVIRAGLVTAVAAGVDGGLLDAKIAWVTADAAYRTPFARSYRVVEELPCREKLLRAALRERDIGRLAIKTRGVDVTPETLRKRLALRGDAEGTLVLTRVIGAGTALLVEPF